LISLSPSNKIRNLKLTIKNYLDTPLVSKEKKKIITRIGHSHLTLAFLFLISHTKLISKEPASICNRSIKHIGSGRLPQYTEARKILNNLPSLYQVSMNIIQHTNLQFFSYYKLKPKVVNLNQS